MLEASAPNGAGKYAPLSAREIEAAGRINASGDVGDDGSVCVMPVPTDAPPFKGVKGASATYLYHYADGQLAMRVHRVERGGGAKDFYPETLWRLPNGRTEWRLKNGPAPRPLFNLHVLRQKPDALVFVVEGEQAAGAAQRICANAVVVTSPGGSRAAGKADWTPLRGRIVWIWGDADEPGKEYVAEVVAQLRGIAREIWIVDALALASRARGDSGSERRSRQNYRPC